MNCDIVILKSDIKEVSSIAVVHNGKILMGKRSDNNRWTLPGGHLEDNESPVDGAVRELFEEAGIKVSPKKLKHLDSKKVSSHTGKKMEIHAYKYEWDGEKPTSKNDPDEEVANAGTDSILVFFETKYIDKCLAMEGVFIKGLGINKESLEMAR